MRCKFCGLETSHSICEYCGYDNVREDEYDTETVTGRNYKEPELNTTRYGGETTAEHQAHARYEEPDFTYEESSFKDPNLSDYRNYSGTRSSGTSIGSSIISFLQKFKVPIVILLFCTNPFAAIMFLIVMNILKNNNQK